VNTVLRWLLAALVGLACRWLAVKVGGTCPLEPHTWFCANWETIAGIAATILIALGYPVERPGLATTKAAQRVEAPRPPPEPEPATSGEIVIPTRTPEEIEADAQRGDGGG
jgi:hypothetical protein